MLLNGFVLGLLTFAGWATVYHKMPEKAKDFAANHSFLVDLATTIATYAALGSTIVALLAAAWVGLFFEVYMYARRNKEDFTWAYDIVERVKLGLKKLGDTIHEKNEEYKAAKAAATNLDHEQDQTSLPAT